MSQAIQDKPEGIKADYTLYTDGVTFLAVDAAALYVAGYGPPEPVVRTRVGGGAVFTTFAVADQETVFATLRRSRQQMDALLDGLVAKGQIEMQGTHRPVVFGVSRIKIGTEELIGRLLAESGLTRDCLEPMPVSRVFPDEEGL